MELETEPHKLTDLAASLDQAARAIDEELRTFARSAQRLSNAWEGEAERAYRQLYSRFHQGSQVQLRVLRAAAASLQDLAKEYASTDKRSARALPVRPTI